MARVFVDTNVLFPFSVMDLMLALTEDAVHEVIWTETLLAEWARVIVRRHHRSAESAASITSAIREFFPESRTAVDLGLRVTDPDQYLCELFDELPQEVIATVVRLAEEKRRPPKTPNDLANDLAKAGVPTFADRLQAGLGRAG